MAGHMATMLLFSTAQGANAVPVSVLLLGIRIGGPLYEKPPVGDQVSFYSMHYNTGPRDMCDIRDVIFC